MRNDVFAGYHPGITFLFFIAAIVCGMCFVHPAFLACAWILAAAYLITIRGSRAFRLIGILAIVFAVVALINPLFNQNGEHVLFTWLGGRAYSLESLCYGMAIGAMFVTILLWFAAYNEVMSSDKFLYLFGRRSPSLSLVLVMVLRLIPGFQKKALQIAGARKCIGKAGSGGSRREALRNGMEVVSALTSWALEGGIITADSMQSRGFGTGRRTSFSIYRFDKRDKTLLGTLLFLLVIVVICGLQGGMKVTYIPAMKIAGADNPYTIIGLIAYILFLAVPTAVNLLEGIKWRSLKSGI